MSLFTASSTFAADDIITGRRVLSYTIRAVAWFMIFAATWSCSTIVMGIIMFICMTLLVGLLAGLVNVVCYLHISDASFARVGSVLNGFKGKFARKAAV